MEFCQPWEAIDIYVNFSSFSYFFVVQYFMNQLVFNDKVVRFHSTFICGICWHSYGFLFFTQLASDGFFPGYFYYKFYFGIYFHVTWSKHFSFLQFDWKFAYFQVISRPVNYGTCPTPFNWGSQTNPVWNLYKFT